MIYQYYIPTRILFGKGSLSTLHEQQLPGKKALIVTSSGGSARRYGYLGKLEHELDLAGAGYVLFDKILPNPTKAGVMEGAALAKAEGCDFVVGLGGGSSIDSAKAISIMARNPGDYWDYVCGGTAKCQPIPHDPLPVVAVTTTAGTGTEADPWTVTTNTDTNEKIGFGYDKTFPVLSVVDHELMMSIPAHLTAYQGFDALFHATEGYINNTANPMSDTFALRSIALLGQNLARAVKNGADEEARGNVALANTLSGFVEVLSGCTSEHSIEHALSAYHPKLPHGAGLIMICLAYYSHFAKAHSCDARMVDMAKALGHADAREPMDFVKAMADLMKECGVDELKMSDYGIEHTNFGKYADNAMSAMGGLFSVDPSPLTRNDVIGMLHESYR